MRLPLIAPAALSPEQKPIYADMRDGIEKNFKGFKAIADDGALIGPWNPWLHDAEIRQADLGADQGAVVLDVAAAAGARGRDPGHRSQVPRRLRDLRPYPRRRAARPARRQLATIVAGQRPADLTRNEAVAYDLASALVSGGVLPELTYRQAVEAFGEHGAAELIYLVGLYCLVSVTLNGFDVPVPE